MYNKELQGIHQEIGSLRDENHQQNMEIALLKEMVGFQDNPNHQKENIEHPNDPTMNKLSTRSGNDRQKRPYRLLPPHNDELDGDGKRKGIIIPSNQQFYGPPTGCSDLSLLGFTLNGFYQVKSNESTYSNITNNDIKLETVFCAFKQPEGTYNPSLVEKRIVSLCETKKPNSKLIFHATRKTDLNSNGGEMYVTFDKVLVNSYDAFDVKIGMFTIPISGVYLLTFRGLVIFPRENSRREFWVSFNNSSTSFTAYLLEEQIYGYLS